MGQVLHGSATTTEAVRRAIQHRQESLRGLAKRYGTVLTVEEEAIIAAFRRHTLLPLDDCLYALQATIPNLTRSSLHRCLQRHGIGRLPDVGSETAAKKKFKIYPIGFFHIDIAEVQTAEGRLYLFVAVDRTSKFALIELHSKATRAEGVLLRCHSFDAACADLDIEHRLTKPAHPWTNGQVERMNRTIKEATVRRYHYEDHT